MSQNDFNLANQGFPSMRSDMNSAFQALASTSAGATAPSTTYAYQLWYDTSTNLLKMRNADNDGFITLAAFDQTNDEWEVRSAVIQAVDSAGVVIKTDDGVARISVADSGVVTIGSSLNVDGAIDLRSNNTAGSALNILRFTDTDPTAQVGQELGKIEFYSSDSNSDAVVASITGKAADASPSGSLLFSTADDTVTLLPRMLIDETGNVGIGTTSPSEPLTISSETSGANTILFEKSNGASTDTELGAIDWSDGTYTYCRIDEYTETGTGGGGLGALRFWVRDGSSLNQAMRIDSSGNLLVGTTGTDPNNATTSGGAGIAVRSDGRILNGVYQDFAADFNRINNDGEIIRLSKDGTTVGSIGVDLSVTYFTGISTGVRFGSTTAAPSGGDGVGVDNQKDLGASSLRWDDIYATNGTIQTSDRNEKQDIEALSDAEQRVAVAAKGLLRKYRWKDAVAEKGDAARIHFGIIAQDLQDAFAAEGLDAGRYGMFISSTWWEADRVIPAVEAQDAVYETVVIPAEYDADGNEISPEATEERLVSEAVEAQPERTVTDTYETQEEAPEGATERTRMGVRYPELLAFIIAAL